MERSAEWLRGEVSALNRLSNFLEWEMQNPKTRGGRPDFPPVMERQSPLLVLLSESVSLLAAAEAREAGEPTAAEVIEACRVALLQVGEWEQFTDHEKALMRKAIGLIDRYKEARHAQ